MNTAYIIFNLVLTLMTRVPQIIRDVQSAMPAESKGAEKLDEARKRIEAVAWPQLKEFVDDTVENFKRDPNDGLFPSDGD